MATQILGRFNARAERAASDAKIAKIVLEAAAAHETPTTVQRASLAGSRERLRGLPALAKGVSGTMPHTQPLGALLEKEQGRRR